MTGPEQVTSYVFCRDGVTRNNPLGLPDKHCPLTVDHRLAAEYSSNSLLDRLIPQLIKLPHQNVANSSPHEATIAYAIQGRKKTPDAFTG